MLLYFQIPIGKLTPRNLWDIPSAITTVGPHENMFMRSALAMPFTRCMARTASPENELGPSVSKPCTMNTYIIACL